MTKFEISSRKIGFGNPAFIIAEAGVNHNGNLETAFRLIDAAKKAGADAVKFQSFKSEEIVSTDAPMAQYQKENLGSDQNQQSMLKNLELSVDDHHQIFEYCQQAEIEFISTPFDRKSVDLLVQIGVSVFKISSGDLTDVFLLEHISKMGKPVILSTGMGSLGEIEEGLGILAELPVAILHCVSDYPAPLEAVNLRAITTLQSAFQRPVGYSDHSIGADVSLGAIALGACIIEKHLTLDCNDIGPDHSASMEPEPFEKFVRSIRSLETCLGDGIKRPRGNEIETAKVVRKSLVAARDLKVGEKVQEDMLTSRRPATGIAPREKIAFIGKTLRRSVKGGDLLEFKDFE